MLKKILVVNPFGIGDMIFSFYAIRALKASDGTIRVDFMGNERTSELARLNEDISRVYEFHRDDWRSLRARNPFAWVGRYGRLISSWNSERYDALVDYSLGREFSFLAKLAGIRIRAGFDFRDRAHFLNRKAPFVGYEKEPVARTQTGLLSKLGLETEPTPAVLPWRIPEVFRGQADLRLEQAHTSSVKTWMGLAPGGGQSWGKNAVYKQWEPGRFAQAANYWAETFDAGVVLFGDASEKKLLEAVHAELRVPSAFFCGEPFGVVASALKRTRFLLCNDGGLLHLAHSLGVRTVSIFGPVDETVYGPYGEGIPHEVLTSGVACRPCYRNFRFPPCRHERCCLDEISVENVLESIGKIT